MNNIFRAQNVFSFLTKIKIYLLKMKIVWFFLAAGVQTKECPSTCWAHAFEFGENMRLFTKAPINEANFYYFTCLKWVSDHKLTCNRPRAMCLGSLNRVQQSPLSIYSLSCCCIAVSSDTNLATNLPDLATKWDTLATRLGIWNLAIFLVTCEIKI